MNACRASAARACFRSGAGRCGPEDEPIPELGWEDLENDRRSIFSIGNGKVKEIET